VHVSLANFIDTLIDYPMSRIYAGELFDRLGEKGILQEEQIKNYKLHVENLEDQANDDDSNWGESRDNSLNKRNPFIQES